MKVLVIPGRGQGKPFMTEVGPSTPKPKRHALYGGLLRLMMVMRLPMPRGSDGQ